MDRVHGVITPSGPRPLPVRAPVTRTAQTRTPEIHPIPNRP
jgi:hypothetical protein